MFSSTVQARKHRSVIQSGGGPLEGHVALRGKAPGKFSGPRRFLLDKLFCELLKGYFMFGGPEDKRFHVCSWNFYFSLLLYVL